MDKVVKATDRMKPPTRIDGAQVLEWAWSDAAFGEVYFPDGTIAAVNHGLALCQYEGSPIIYRLSCNADWETEQDSDHASLEEAKAQLPDQYRRVPAMWIKA